MSVAITDEILRMVEEGMITPKSVFRPSSYAVPSCLLITQQERATLQGQATHRDFVGSVCAHVGSAMHVSV